MEKITLIQAAQILSLHPNTLKNWQKAGRLPSAEKIKVKGKDVWFVALEDVRNVANNEQTIYQTIPNRQEPINDPPTDPTDTPQQATTANNAQALDLWRETYIVPLERANADLLKSNDDKTKRIDELSHANGVLEERVRNLEAQLQERLRMLQAAQAAREAQPAPQPPPPAPIIVQPVETPQNAPQPKRGLLGGWFTRKR